MHLQDLQGLQDLQDLRPICIYVMQAAGQFGSNAKNGGTKHGAVKGWRHVTGGGTWIDGCKRGFAAEASGVDKLTEAMHVVMMRKEGGEKRGLASQPEVMKRRKWKREGGEQEQERSSKQKREQKYWRTVRRKIGRGGKRARSQDAARKEKCRSVAADDDGGG